MVESTCGILAVCALRKTRWFKNTDSCFFAFCSSLLVFVCVHQPVASLDRKCTLLPPRIGVGVGYVILSTALLLLLMQSEFKDFLKYDNSSKVQLQSSNCTES